VKGFGEVWGSPVLIAEAPNGGSGAEEFGYVLASDVISPAVTRVPSCDGMSELFARVTIGRHLVCCVLLLPI
jgi:hypothetical protein